MERRNGEKGREVRRYMASKSSLLELAGASVVSGGAGYDSTVFRTSGSSAVELGIMRNDEL